MDEAIESLSGEAKSMTHSAPKRTSVSTAERFDVRIAAWRGVLETSSLLDEVVAQLVEETNETALTYTILSLTMLAQCFGRDINSASKIESVSCLSGEHASIATKNGGGEKVGQPRCSERPCRSFVISYIQDDEGDDGDDEEAATATFGFFVNNVGERGAKTRASAAMPGALRIDVTTCIAEFCVIGDNRSEPMSRLRGLLADAMMPEATRAATAATDVPETEGYVVEEALAECGVVVEPANAAPQGNEGSGSDETEASMPTEPPAKLFSELCFCWNSLSSF